MQYSNFGISLIKRNINMRFARQFLVPCEAKQFKSRLHLNGLILGCVDIMFLDLASVICLGLGCINFHVVIGEALSHLHNILI